MSLLCNMLQYLLAALHFRCPDSLRSCSGTAVARRSEMRLRASLSMRLGSLSSHSSPSCMCSRYIFRYLPRLPLTAEVPRPEASPMTPFSVAGFSKPGSVSKLSQISLTDWHRWKHTYRKVRVVRCCRCPNCLPGIPCQESGTSGRCRTS